MAETPYESWRELLVDAHVALQLGSLWGKSPEKAGGRTNLLIQHLFDAAAVAGLVWDEFLARSVRERLDEVAGGNGRQLYVWLTGLHDLGKATPGFQGQVPALADAVRKSGLPIPHRSASQRPWRHERASGALVRVALLRAWPDGRAQVEWLWPMVAGHHGIIPPVRDVDVQKPAAALQLGERAVWSPVQQLILEVITRATGYPGVAAACPHAVPTRAEQLALGGFVTMADWIASDERHFTGIDRLDDVGLGPARGRADVAWGRMGMQGGWGDALPEPTIEKFSVRFPGRSPRSLQTLAVDAAASLRAPGLMLIEAPMGEGKTEAALCAAEMLASRFGADGVCVAMPTQATSDAMYARVDDWLRTFGTAMPLALLHGRHLLSERIRARVACAVDDVPLDLDEYGQPDEPPSYRSVAEDRPSDEASEHPAEWFYGRYQGLLTANAVGTVDQVLFAATRTKYVALRFAGLLGKVVIFDEVHAADCYMSVFLREALFWLGNGGVPVVLLSATLPPAQREELVGWYVDGAACANDVEPVPPEKPVGYPRVLTACVTDRVHYASTVAAPWRTSTQVAVTACEEDGESNEMAVVQLLRDRLSEGGCALVIRNTVRRAQQTYGALAGTFGDGEVVLLHSLFTATARERKTRELLSALGEDGTRRPARLVVVSTQVAEQSFDVDADLLVTDLAPIDLLLQRAGRIHRHARPPLARPARVRSPEIVVTGVLLRGNVPEFPAGSVHVYGDHLLLRAAALTMEAVEQGGWSIPADVPNLVERGYGDEPLGPESWAGAESKAAASWRDEITTRRSVAEQYRLVEGDDRGRTTLEGLHVGDADVRHVRVRDGDMGDEVVLVTEGDGGFSTVDGLYLGPNGDAARDRPEEVLGASVRLPAYLASEPKVVGLTGLPGWQGDPWLGRSTALRLRDDGPVQLGAWTFRYDSGRGLLVEKLR